VLWTLYGLPKTGAAGAVNSAESLSSGASN
jgi:hypothetical protein